MVHELLHPVMLIFDHAGFPTGDYDSLDSGLHSQATQEVLRLICNPPL